MIQLRNDGGWLQDCSDRGGEKWSATKHMFKVQSRGLASMEQIEPMAQREGSSQDFALGCLKDTF